MKSILFAIILYALLPFSGVSQSLNSKEIEELMNIISQYLENNDRIPAYDNTNRPVEYILCYLDVDSTGAVSDIRLLADDKNKDSAFYCLSRMKTADLKSWKAEQCKGKTVLMPILSLAHGRRLTYIQNIQPLYAENQLKVLYETNKLVAVDVFRYMPPTLIIEKEVLEPEPIKVETKPGKNE